MTKVHIEDRYVNQLCEALLTLTNIDESKSFIVDLCTSTEIQALAQRLEVARLLKDGHTYDEVECATGASTATISRIKRFLNHGNNGYKVVLDRLKSDNEH